MTKAKTLKEPMFHIVKREPLPFARRALVRLIGVICGMAACGILILCFTGLNPAVVFSTMVDANFGNLNTFWITVRDTMILLLVGVALAPAFKMRFWNVGGEGQILIGGFATAACMRLLSEQMSSTMLFLTMILASMAAGMIWGLIPAVFKAKWNTNETLFTLMMNYIAIQIVSAYSIIWEAKKGSGSIGVINLSTKAGWLNSVLLPDVLGKRNFMVHVLIVMVLAVLMFVYMRYTKHGYEISVVGESTNTARYAGINVDRVILRTMMLSGAICGLAGFILVSGSSHTISTVTADNRGFTAIIVAWLGKLNPFYMLLISFFLIFMDYGAMGVATACRLNESFSDIITGVLLFFILGCEFFINYRIVKRGHHREVA